MTTAQAPIHAQPTPPDALCASDALGCGEHTEAIRVAIETGDWSHVARLAEADPDERRAA